MKRKKKTGRKYLSELQPGVKVILNKGNGFYIDQNFSRATKDLEGIVKHAIDCVNIYVQFNNGIYARCSDNTLTIVGN